MDVPAAPTSLVRWPVSGRSQVAIRDPAVKEDTLFPILDPPKDFFRSAECSYIVAAERLQIHELARQQNDRDEWRLGILRWKLGSRGQMRLINGDLCLLECRDNLCRPAAAMIPARRPDSRRAQA